MVDGGALALWAFLLALGIWIGLWLGRRLRPAAEARERERLLERLRIEREQVLREASMEREQLLRAHRSEMEGLAQRHQSALEDARKTSVAASRRTLTGQVTEKLAPHFPDFPYDPTELRFLGTPVDYVVFKGLSADAVEEIIFLEVKSGKSTLTKRERSIRSAIRGVKVRWEEFRIGLEETQEVQVDVQSQPSS